MPQTDLYFDQDARTSMLNGIQQLANAVKSTMGPRGSHAVISRPSKSPLITRRGSDIAGAITLSNPAEHVGIEVMRDIAERVGNTTGDGTSAAIVIAHALIQLGLQHAQGGGSSSDLVMGFDVALKTLLAEISSQSNAIDSLEEIRKVAGVAANRDKEIVDLIANAYKTVGMSGSILVAESDNHETTMHTKRTLNIDHGYESNAFTSAEETGELMLDNCFILLTDEALESIRDLTQIIEKVTHTNKPLLLIAPEFGHDVIEWFDTLNGKQEYEPIVPVRSPGFGRRQKAILQDIATVTGGRLLSRQIGLTIDHAELADMGSAKTIFLGQDHVTIVEGYGRDGDISARIHQIRNQIQDADSDDERNLLLERLSNLSGGAAIIYVGDISRDLLERKKRRIRQAIKACEAAIEEGIMPGGGVAYIRLQEALKTFQGKYPEHADAYSIIRKALEASLRYIAENADSDPDTVVRTVQNSNGGYGFNALTRSYEDLIAIGVYDPAKVVRCVLEHALTYAGIVITTGVSIVPRG